LAFRPKGFLFLEKMLKNLEAQSNIKQRLKARQFSMGQREFKSCFRIFHSMVCGGPSIGPSVSLSSNNQPFKRKSCDDNEKMVSDGIPVHGGNPGVNGSGCFSGVYPGF
jgi:hypothetical protein